VVLYGERGAEERHDAVARSLVHSSFKAVNGIHHLRRIGSISAWASSGSLPAMSAIDPLRSAKRTGDQLALALERGTARKDAFGEMRWWVGLSGEKAWCRAGQRTSAFMAELVADVVRCATGGACCQQSSAALAAELHSVGFSCRHIGQCMTIPIYTLADESLP
jgi:hypothetical protein